jgi:hypothetical protein
MRITIDTDASLAQATQPAAGGAGSTMAASGSADSMPSQATASSTSDLITKALSTGAQNAGPAPSSASTAGARGPISASIGGASSETPAMSYSAGAPPPHIYEPQGGCK